MWVCRFPKPLFCRLPAIPRRLSMAQRLLLKKKYGRVRAALIEEKRRVRSALQEQAGAFGGSRVGSHCPAAAMAGGGGTPAAAFATVGAEPACSTGAGARRWV